MASKSDYQRKKFGTRLHFRRQFSDPTRTTKSGAPKKWSSPWLPTKDEVNKWVEIKRAELAAEAAAIEKAADPSRMTLRVMWETWVAKALAGDRRSKKRIRRSTARGYLISLRSHVPEELQNKDIRDITEEELQQWLEDVEAKHGIDAAGRGLRHMKMAYNWAIEARKLTTASPAALLYGPAKPVLTHEEMKRRAKATGARFYTDDDPDVVTWFMTQKMVGILLGIADALSEKGYVGEDPGGRISTPRKLAWQRYRALVYVLFLTGIRIGEALALMWSEVHFTRKVITIESTLSETDEGRVLESPKTVAGLRDIPIPDDLIPILEAWRAQRPGDGFVFGTNAGRTPEWRQNFYNRAWKLMFALADGEGTGIAFRDDGVPVAGIHDARHFHASVLFEMKLDSKVIARRLGHGDEATTRRIYVKLLPQSVEEETAKIQGLLGSIREAAK